MIPTGGRKPRPVTRRKNAVLAAALESSGLSPRDLVRAVNTKLASAGEPALHGTVVYQWLDGSAPRDLLTRRLTAVALSEASDTDISPAALWGRGDIRRPKAATDQLIGPRSLTEVLDAAAFWTSSAHPYADVRAVAADRFSSAVWDATHQVAVSRIVATGSTERVTPPLMAFYEEQLKWLRRLDDQTGGSALSQRRVRAALADVISLLRTSKYIPSIRTRLLRNAAGLAQLAGWMSFDADLAAAAQRHQLFAIRLARAAGDHDTVSNVLGMLAYQHAATGYPAEAVRYASSAVEHAAKSLPLVRARALGRLATALASTGDVDGFRRAADGCRELIAHRTPDDPVSLYYLTDHQIAAESGHALVELAVARTAGRRPLLREATGLLSPLVNQGSTVGYQRSAVLHGIHLARTGLLTRDTETTAHTLTAVVEHLQGVESLRCRALLRNVRRSAARPLGSAGRSDVLDTVDRALSGP
ncbi:hypothetical protein ACFWNT_13830 [Streptomyces sp. NPDC058409]|uniref:hypothetical protein n=1 Tax=Streptomyces sp. NPDC058409 TaxID=3346484 RepID=UPI00364A3D68